MAGARGVPAAVEESGDGDGMSAAVGVCAFDASATAARIVAEAEVALRRARRGAGVADSAAS